MCIVHKYFLLRGAVCVPCDFFYLLNGPYSALESLQEEGPVSVSPQDGVASFSYPQKVVSSTLLQQPSEEVTTLFGMGQFMGSLYLPLIASCSI